MRKFLILIPLLTACIQQKAIMTKECFAEVQMGDTVAEIEKKCGKPYAIRAEGTATDVYEYMENIYASSVVVETRRYFILVSNGKVVGKYARYANTPGVFRGMYPETPYPNY